MSRAWFAKGNEAMAEAAILAGCRYYFGYPITPQNEVPAYMSRRLPEVGGVFLQAESEVAAINMVFGAAVAGARAMTSSSSPGISLKQEGISYLAGCELPAVIANVVRGGPGLGSISPAQSDYWQATRGGGHGDYRTPVLAPATVQELAELTMDAFDIADFYRNPVLILSDGLLGQMMESVTLPDPQERRRNGWLAGRELPAKTWALTGARGRAPQSIRSLIMVPGELEKHNFRLAEKYALMQKNDAKAEITGDPHPQVVLAAYGSSARLAKGALELLKARGIRAALFRPITLWPFPSEALAELAKRVDRFVVVEMSLGQFIEDVQLAVAREKSLKQVRIGLLARPGGGIPSPEEIVAKVLEVLA
ncbi:MAG: 3-methyl-2-oxobutanoate dehydrogenase subunit VorB [Candidatus Firestonebacteria bacterium]|nr:3-methyl-2-oxobutanoate dehydrogenase subunit VorB [Candidatus Firestonebacteria bacterium]